MLKLLQPGIQPLGQFDGYDADTLLFKGGELCTLISVPSPGQPGVSAGGFDKAAYDVFDGYTNPGGVQMRPAVSRSMLASGKRPLFLSDDGIVGYGTLLGAVLGGTVGQQINNPSNQLTGYTGALLGPSTATGSGKVTCWDKPGLYAVSLDACDTNASTGLQPTNTTINTGSALYGAMGSYSGGGVLTPNSAIAFETVVVGRFLEFNTNGSLVTTPNYLVAALNSPSGNVSSVGPRQFAFATFTFLPPV